MIDPRIRVEKAFAWVASCIIAIAAGIAFLFTTFQTNAEAGRVRDDQEKRLDRMDKKLDVLIQRGK